MTWERQGAAESPNGPTLFLIACRVWQFWALSVIHIGLAINLAINPTVNLVFRIVSVESACRF